MKNITQPKKILFFRLDNCLGDSIVHSFVLRELKKLFSEAHLTVATFAPSDHFFELNPHVDKLITLPPLGPADQPYRYFRPAILWSLLKMLAHSWINHYDLVILPHTVRTPANQLYSHLLPHMLLPPYDYTKPIQQAFVRMLKQLGAKEIDTTYEFPVLSQHKEYAQQFLQEHGLQSDQFCVINPIGSVEYKNLSRTQIQAIIDKLHSAHIAAVLLDYKNKFADMHALIRFTSSSIFETAALIKESSAVISVDTGIVHLADCFGKKLFILYPQNRQGPYNRLFWPPMHVSFHWLQSTDSVRDIPVENILSCLEKHFL